MPMTAESFRAWREHMGVTKAQLGEWLGASPRTITNYETGRHPIPQVVNLACAALGLGVRDFNGAAPAASPDQ